MDDPRSWTPKKITEIQKNKVIQLACSKPDWGYSNWSQKRIGAEVGISQNAVSVLLRKDELRPHKTDYWCGKSTDPEFESKMLTVVWLYLNPPEN